MLNVFCITGQVAEKPEISETPGGIKMAKLAINVKRPFANSMGIYEDDRIELEVWRGLSETLERVCKTGTWVSAKGRIASRTTKKDGKKYTNYAFVAERVDVMD
ncbi:single-stranded DNA-binding protein [Faecalibaculum rodentium]|uniref:single-stranded DNA-binding protein n=1 Tax=Faecalibaculum rodentium TaxID=1702221 RepID=UPI0023F54E70|nr:single-stranded DNA-binding protein [Faecalibaculum rodentium]